MLIPITFPMHQILHSSASFSMLLYFFNFVFFFFINNCWWSSTCCPLNCSSLHLVSSSSLNTLCIIHSSGSSSWNTSRPMFFEILKSLYLFWFSFFEDLFEWIFLLSSHILSPTFNPWGFLLFLSNYFFIFFCTSFINFVTSSQLLCDFIRNSSSLGISICILRFSF